MKGSLSAFVLCSVINISASRDLGALVTIRTGFELHALQKCQNAFLGNQAKYSSVFLCLLFSSFFSGEFYQRPSLSFRPLLPLWHWLSTPLPHRVSLHFLGTEGCWRMPPLPPWTVLWQACNSRALRCSPVSCWVNTSATSVSSPHSECKHAQFCHFSIIGIYFVSFTDFICGENGHKKCFSFFLSLCQSLPRVYFIVFSPYGLKHFGFMCRICAWIKGTSTICQQDI